MNNYSLSKPSFLKKKKKSYLHKPSHFPYILVLYSRKRDFSHIIPLLLRLQDLHGTQDCDPFLCPHDHSLLDIPFCHPVHQSCCSKRLQIQGLILSPQLLRLSGKFKTVDNTLLQKTCSLLGLLHTPPPHFLLCPWQLLWCPPPPRKH